MLVLKLFPVISCYGQRGCTWIETWKSWPKKCNALPAKITLKIFMVVLSDEICLIQVFFITQKERVLYE